MVVNLLDASRIAELRSQALTYSHDQCPLAVPPPGYAHFSRTHRLAEPVDFAAVGRALMAWQVQARSGLQLSTSSLQVETGAVIIMRFGVGFVALSIPCRVVAVVDEHGKLGFSYGTLPGHPVSGEESFLLQRTPNGVTTFTVSAFSRPASRLGRLGGSLVVGAQRFMTSRYLRALG